MAQGQVRGGALRVREAHKSINPEGRPQRFRGDRESIPTTINFLKMNQSLPVRPYFAPNAPRWCFEEPKDTVSHLPEGMNGWRMGKVCAA